MAARARGFAVVARAFTALERGARATRRFLPALAFACDLFAATLPPMRRRGALFLMLMRFFDLLMHLPFLRGRFTSVAHSQATPSRYNRARGVQCRWKSALKNREALRPGV